MKDLIIAGAGGFGRGAFEVALAINKQASSPIWRIKGFINDVAVDLEKWKIDVPVIGTIKDWIPGEDEYFIVGISSPQGKEKVASLLKSRGAKFATLIHPKATVNSTATLGEGCVIHGGSVVERCAKLGSFVHVAGSMIGSGAVVGDYSTLTGYVNVTNAQIGKRVFVGTHSAILNNVKVGDDAFICAGSIVFSDVKSGRKVIGYPAVKAPF